MKSFVISEDTHTMHLTEWEQICPGLVAGFTLRTGGVSEGEFASFNQGLHVGDDPASVIGNRRLLSERLRMPFEAWTCADQVHGKQIGRITETNRGAGRKNLHDCIPATDGLHTNTEGTLLTSFYADCVPLFFLDRQKKAIGLAHAGWKGTVARIGAEMVAAFAREYGSQPTDLLVAIGPAIGQCCYEVDQRIIDQVKAAAADWEKAVSPAADGKYMLDLPMLNRLILQETGIPENQIATCGWCTSCHPERFFSYRKEAGKTGRMASFIGWREEGE